MRCGHIVRNSWGFAIGWFSKGGFGGCSLDPQTRTRVQKNGTTDPKKTEGGYQKHIRQTILSQNCPFVSSRDSKCWVSGFRGKRRNGQKVAVWGRRPQVGTEFGKGMKRSRNQWRTAPFHWLRVRHSMNEGFWKGIPQERLFSEEVRVEIRNDSVNCQTLRFELFFAHPLPKSRLLKVTAKRLFGEVVVQTREKDVSTSQLICWAARVGRVAWRIFWYFWVVFSKRTLFD